VPFTLVHAGKYRTEDKLKIQTIKKLNTTQQNKTTLGQLPLTTLGQEMRWAYYTILLSPHKESILQPISGEKND